jgi:hypothetical protein
MVVVMEQDQRGGDDPADPPRAAAVAAQHRETGVLRRGFRALHLNPPPPACRASPHAHAASRLVTRNGPLTHLTL